MKLTTPLGIEPLVSYVSYTAEPSKHKPLPLLAWHPVHVLDYSVQVSRYLPMTGDLLPFTVFVRSHGFLGMSAVGEGASVKIMNSGACAHAPVTYNHSTQHSPGVLHDGTLGVELKSASSCRAKPHRC